MTRLIDAITLSYHIAVIGIVAVVFMLLWYLELYQHWWELVLDIICLAYVSAIAWLHCLALLNWEARR